jgi:hypothetical protein
MAEIITTNHPDWWDRIVTKLKNVEPKSALTRKAAHYFSGEWDNIQ